MRTFKLQINVHANSTELDVATDPFTVPEMAVILGKALAAIEATVERVAAGNPPHVAQIFRRLVEETRREPEPEGAKTVVRSVNIDV